MADGWTLAAAVFSAIATALAAFATWYAPRAAAKYAEALRLDAERTHQRQKSKLQIFATLMQERSAIYSTDGVRALNMIDVAFRDSRPVREAWAELFLIFNSDPMPQHAFEERLRKLLIAMAGDIGIGDSLRTDDINRIYIPRVIAEERRIRDLQRQQALTALQGGGSPAANTVASTMKWPPPPN